LIHSFIHSFIDSLIDCCMDDSNWVKQWMSMEIERTSWSGDQRKTRPDGMASRMIWRVLACPMRML